MTKYLILIKCPESDTYHLYKNMIVDHKDTAVSFADYLNNLMKKSAMNNDGYHFIVSEIEFDEL